VAGTFIHPTSQVDSTAILGTNVYVGPFSIIGPNVSIGDESVIASHVLVECNTVLGKKCRLYTGTAIGIDPQDMKYTGEEETWLEIGDHAVLREYSSIARGSVRSTQIGSHFILMGQAHVSHDCQIGQSVVVSNAVHLLDHVMVGDYGMIGGLTFVNRHCRIGSLSFVGGGFRVVKDVPPFIIAGDEPLQISAINVVALQKRGYTQEQLGNITQAYKILHTLSGNTEAAVTKIRTELAATEEIGAILDFIEVSERGII